MIRVHNNRFRFPSKKRISDIAERVSKYDEDICSRKEAIEYAIYSALYHTGERRGRDREKE